MDIKDWTVLSVPSTKLFPLSFSWFFLFFWFLWISIVEVLERGGFIPFAVNGNTIFL